MLRNSSSLKGIILAGGQSRRFGSDKALALHQDKTFLKRQIQLLQNVGLEPVIVASRLETYSFMDCNIIADIIPGQGPLSGLHAAFNTFPETLFLVLTCDMPNLHENVLNHLIQQHQISDSATVYRLNAEDRQPFPGIYSGTFLPQIVEQMNSFEFSMKKFLEKLPALHEIKNIFDANDFLNVNYKKDMEQVHPTLSY